MSLPRLNCLHRQYCILTSAKVKYIKFTWQAAQDCTTFSLCHHPIFLPKEQEVQAIAVRTDYLPAKEMSGLIYPFQSLVPSYLRSVFHNKQTSCLSVLKDICYWYNRDKRITRHLPLATGHSAWGDWAHRGLDSWMDWFVSMKRHSQFTVLGQAVEWPSVNRLWICMSQR